VTTATPIVEARELHKTYDGSGAGVPALRGVSMVRGIWPPRYDTGANCLPS
jgi:hypothetical protein